MSHRCSLAQQIDRENEGAKKGRTIVEGQGQDVISHWGEGAFQTGRKLPKKGIGVKPERVKQTPTKAKRGGLKGGSRPYRGESRKYRHTSGSGGRNSSWKVAEGATGGLGKEHRAKVEETKKRSAIGEEGRVKETTKNEEEKRDKEAPRKSIFLRRGRARRSQIRLNPAPEKSSPSIGRGMPERKRKEFGRKEYGSLSQGRPR